MNPAPESAARAICLRRIRGVLAFFIIALILSGITAFPLQSELERIVEIRRLQNLEPAEVASSFDGWILTVQNGLRESYAKYPWLAYGTDWLAFAHLITALFFVGAWVDPVRNVWILKAGIMGCLLVIPMALICGAVRQIPIGWRLLDCSFGVFGFLPLIYSLSLTRLLEGKVR